LPEQGTENRKAGGFYGAEQTGAGRTEKGRTDTHSQVCAVFHFRRDHRIRELYASRESHELGLLDYPYHFDRSFGDLEFYPEQGIYFPLRQ
jgi:hypothetical protein